MEDKPKTIERYEPSYRIVGKKLADRMVLNYGNDVTLAFDLEEPPMPDDIFILAIDDDLRFVHNVKMPSGALENQLFAFSDMAKVVGSQIQFDLNLRTLKYRERVNGKESVDVYVQILRNRMGRYTSILNSTVKAYGSVYDPKDSATPVFPPTSNNVGWSEILGKPDTFPPSEHTQDIGTINGLTEKLESLSKPKEVTWNEVKNKPETFTPSAHTQDISTVNGLTEQLNQRPLATSLYEIETKVLQGTEVVMDEKNVYKWNASGDCKISRGKWKLTAETWSTAYIDVAQGATVTGVDITIIGDLVAGQRNYCQLKGFDNEVRMYVLESYEVAL